MFPELITELLQDGYKVNFSAPGHSMFPTIMANESIIVEPIAPETVRLRDIILYRYNCQLIAHRVVSIEKMLEVSLTTPRSALPAPFRLPIKDESPLFKRSAPQAQRSSSTALQFILRGDAAANCDKPVKPAQILGKVIAIERCGHSIDPYSCLHRFSCFGLTWLARSKRLLRFMSSSFSKNSR